MTELSFPLWRLELLGELRLTRLDLPDAAPVSRFRSRKTAALLVYLALRRGTHRREVLSELFWPETDPDDARNSLRVALASLRAILEPEGVIAGTVVLVSRENVGLSGTLTTDIENFRGALRGARAISERAARRGALEEALNWYRGRLATLEAADWLTGEDDRLEDDFTAGLDELVTLCEGEGQAERALEIARRGLEKAPFREEIALEVLRLSLVLGKPEAARDFKKWCERAKKQGFPVEAQSLGVAKVTPRAAPLPSPVAVPIATPQHLPRVRGLPPEWTTFFGRESEVATLQSNLGGKARLHTLSGSGGVGKTRLAMQVARRIAAQKGADFGLIVWLSLADLPVASLVPAALAEVLRAARRKNRGSSPFSMLRAARPAGGSARVLLVLDGFEQLCDDGAPLVREWLHAMPELTCWTISRRPLGFVGEAKHEVWPLRIDAIPQKMEAAENESEAVALFLDRARLARPDWEITPENRRAIAKICAHLQGLPLALEIAASRLELFSPAQLLAEIEAPSLQNLDLETNFESVLSWKNPDRAAPPRHATLRACIAWSERQLPTSAARLWAQCSIFCGGFTLEAASQICDCDAAPLILELQNASLLRLDTRGDTVRAAQLESNRQYAAQLLEDGERAALQERHARYFNAWIKAQNPDSALVEAENLNLKCALGWFLRHESEGAPAISQALKRHKSEKNPS